LIKKLYLTIIMVSLFTPPFVGSVAMASESKDTNSTISMAKAKQDVIDWLESLVSEPDKWQEKISDVFDTNSTDVTNKVMSYLGSRLPLLNNSKLNMVAQAICDESIVNGFGGNVTDINEKLSAVDYSTKQAEVVRSAVVMQDYLSPEDGASILFLNLLKSMRNKGTLLFNDKYVEFGVGYCRGVVSIDKDTRANVYLLTMVFARPEGPQPKWVQCGHIYFDKNNNNEFDPCEGLRNVVIESNKKRYLATSGFDGKYCFKRPRGEWVLYLEGYPFYQDYNAYSYYLEEDQEEGILIKDYKLSLPQQIIETINSSKPKAHELEGS